MKPFYRPILAEAWHISRSNLFLWPLAFFASLVGIFGTFQVFSDMAGGGESLTLASWYNESDFMASTFIGWSQSLSQIPWGSVGIAEIPLLMFFFLLLFLVIALAIIITSSEGGLMYALAQLQNKKRANYLESFRQGLDRFWSLFSVNLIYRLLYLGITTLVIVPLLYQIIAAGPAFRLGLAVLIYLFIVPLVIIFDLVTRYSLLYIMVYGQTVRESIRNAWLLFWTNWLISLETSVVVLATLFGAFLVVSVLLVPGLVLLFTMFGSLISTSAAATQLFIFTALIILILVIALFVTFFTSFQLSIWVSVFRKLTTGEHHSKIHRLFRHLPWLHQKVA